MLSIYIAGASSERELIRGYMKRVREIGYTITEDWVATVDAHGGVANEGVPKPEVVASNNMHGVLAADVFWLVLPSQEQPSIGCWVELGYAYRSTEVKQKMIIVSGDRYDRTIFTALADATFTTHAIALSYLADLRAGDAENT